MLITQNDHHRQAVKHGQPKITEPPQRRHGRPADRTRAAPAYHGAAAATVAGCRVSDGPLPWAFALHDGHRVRLPPWSQVPGRMPEGPGFRLPTPLPGYPRAVCTREKRSRPETMRHVMIDLRQARLNVLITSG